MTERPDSDPIVQSTGSPSQGEPVFLVIGKIRRPHGIRGELVMEVHTDFPERIEPGESFFVGNEQKVMKLRSVRPHKDMLLISFEGLDTPEGAGLLRNSLVYVRSDDRPPLPEGEYYHHELIGLQVDTDEGQILGEVTDLLSTGANDVLLVRSEGGGEILLPLTDEVVLEVDLEAGRMLVHLLAGLL